MMMILSSPPPLELSDAVELIVSKTAPACSERINLKEGLGRVLAYPVFARIPQPEFDQSVRDGFVICDQGVQVEDSTHKYIIRGEIAAGPGKDSRLVNKTACRIMTGGIIPPNAIRVIPFENCREAESVLFVSKKALSVPDTYIRRKGSAICAGQVLLEAGEMISVSHMNMLASTGLLDLEVYRKGVVACFSTGSELLPDAQRMKTGVKISANRYLLNGLILSSGAQAEDKGIVGDSLQDISRIIKSIDPDRTDIIISTGGMGPGKYDLLEKAFFEAGGQIFFRSLNVRPGKSILFGMFGSALFFGLPGPPAAVHILFNELILPALSAIQGGGQRLPVVVKAFLAEDILIPGNVLLLKGGCLSLNEGKCEVRPITGNDPSNCTILLYPDKQQYEKGEMVSVHLAGSALFSSSLS